MSCVPNCWYETQCGDPLFALRLPTLRMNSIRGAYVPCSKRTCLIGSAGGERKMCPKRVILRLRHASGSLTCLYLDVSASVLITIRFVHSRSTCTRLSIFIWNASIWDCSALVSCIVSRPCNNLLKTHQSPRPCRSWTPNPEHLKPPKWANFEAALQANPVGAPV